jgi:hypothetical protein
MDTLTKLFHETTDFIRKGLDEDSTELLPKVVVTGALFAVAAMIYIWLPDHDPANPTRRAA